MTNRRIILLEIQKYLRAGNLEKLYEDHRVSTNFSPDGSRVIFNYDIAARKDNVIANESRALVLENKTWNVVAKAFTRFFNLGEIFDHKHFNWNSFDCYEKVDGSLILLYYYDGEWRVNTRNSFGEGKIHGCSYSWKELFLSTIKLPEEINEHKYLTFVFELCSPYNQVVKFYETPRSYLLGIFDKESGEELSINDKVYFAQNIFECKLPEIFPIHRYPDLTKYINQLKENKKLDEGCIVKDSNGMRIKVKNPFYVEVHHLKDNNNISLPSRLVKFCVSQASEKDEILSYFPDLKNRLDKTESFVYDLRDQTAKIWNKAKHRKTRKEFALSVKDSKFAPLLFKLYDGEDFEKLWKSEKTEDYILKVFEKDLEKLYD